MKFFGMAVKNTVPVEPEWEFTYSNWWNTGEEVSIYGSKEECLRQQKSIESFGWESYYCYGHGPAEALTIYIGPRRK